MTGFISKYHTYIVVAVAFLTAAYQVAFNADVPVFVYDALAALGITSYRVTLTQTTGVSGWKSYALAAGMGILAALRAYGIAIPPEVDGMVATLAGASFTGTVKKTAVT